MPRGKRKRVMSRQGGRAKRVDPLEQGKLRYIWQHFFGKLLPFKPVSMSINEWMGELFDIKNRHIGRYVAVKPFRLPGLLYITPYIKYQGVGRRNVPAGAEFFVRTDSRNPDSIQVEWLSGRSGQEQVFELNASEWGRMRLNLEEAAFEGEA